MPAINATPAPQNQAFRGTRRASAELHDHVTTLRGTLSARAALALGPRNYFPRQLIAGR